MSEFVLHHYPMSPFAEKIRLILGFKGMAWRSVVIPTVMPKPDLVALTGGNRRTPVLQRGADVWCDTALIARVLDAHRPEPALLPPAQAASASLAAAWADQAWFGAGVAWAMQPAGFASLFEGVPPEQVAAFVEDRKAFRRGATVPRMSLDAAAALLGAQLAQLEAQLADGRRFALGDAPTLADFSLYHPLWFVRRAAAVAAPLDAHPHVARWMERIAAIGHGAPQPMSSQEALELARASQPVWPATITPAAPSAPAASIASSASAVSAASAASSDRAGLATTGLPEGVAIGARVSVAPTDYGIDPVAGELVAVALDEVVVRRTDPRAGTVHVHFPRIGYRIEAAA